MSLILYGAPLSPFVRKVDVVLREKSIEFEAKSVMMPFPDWFLEISPARRMPVLRDTAIAAEGKAGTIPDSSAICGFLERRNPDPSVYPKQAFEYGRALWLEEWADSELAGAVGLGIFRPIVFARMAGKEPDLASARTAWNEKLPRFFDYLEAELEGKTFLAGDVFSIADIAVACQLINLELVVGLPDATRWPSLVAFNERISSRPSFGPNLAISKKVIPEAIDLSA
jgi:glutathione S-transferase